MAKSRNPLKDLSDLSEMPIVKNWINCVQTLRNYNTDH